LVAAAYFLLLTPAGRRDAGNEPVGREPVGKEPVGKEPVGDEPVGDEPVEPGRLWPKLDGSFTPCCFMQLEYAANAFWVELALVVAASLALGLPPHAARPAADINATTPVTSQRTRRLAGGRRSLDLIFI
jgi:hypothetical protein